MYSKGIENIAILSLEKINRTIWIPGLISPVLFYYMDEGKCHKPLPLDKKSMKEVIQYLRKANIEYLYFFNKSGKQIRRFKGEQNQIIIEDIFLYEMKDAIVIHNHPNGNSFSIEDVIACIKFNAAEVILITQTFTYQIIRPFQGWRIDVDTENFKSQIKVCIENAEIELDKLLKHGEITFHEKEIEKIHYLWIFFFALNDIKYVRKKET